MKCKICGREFAETTPAQKYCSRECLVKSQVLKPKPAREPYEFRCAHCGKPVVTAPYNDQRYKYCSRRCHDRAKEQRRDKRKRVGNNGMTCGMSLGSLIRRERRDLA